MTKLDPVIVKLARGDVVYTNETGSWEEFFKDFVYCEPSSFAEGAATPRLTPSITEDMKNNNPVLAVFFSDPRHPFGKCSRFVVLVCLFVANLMWVAAEMNVVCAFRINLMNEQAQAAGYAQGKSAWDAKRIYTQKIQVELNKCQGISVPTEGSWDWFVYPANMSDNQKANGYEWDCNTVYINETYAPGRCGIANITSSMAGQYKALDNFEQGTVYKYVVPLIVTIYSMILASCATCACLQKDDVGSTTRMAGAVAKAAGLSTFLCIVTPIQLIFAFCLTAYAEPFNELGFFPNGTGQSIMEKVGWVYFLSTCVYGPFTDLAIYSYARHTELGALEEERKKEEASPKAESIEMGTTPNSGITVSMNPAGAAPTTASPAMSGVATIPGVPAAVPVMPPGQQVQVTVPPGSGPGQIVALNVGGQTFQVQVPMGVGPGQVFLVQI